MRDLPRGRMDPQKKEGAGDQNAYLRVSQPAAHGAPSCRELWPPHLRGGIPATQIWLRLLRHHLEQRGGREAQQVPTPFSGKLESIWKDFFLPVGSQGQPLAPHSVFITGSEALVHAVSTVIGCMMQTTKKPLHE